MKITRSIIIAVLFLLLHSFIPAQEIFKYDAGVEKYFLSGIKYYENSDYQNSFSVFDSLMIKKPVNQRTTASYLMAAKSLYKMKKYKAAIILLNELLKNYPATTYRGDALLNIGINYLFIQRNIESAFVLRDCIENGDSASSLNAERLLDEISAKYLTQNDIERLLPDSKSVHVKDFLKLKSAQKYYYSGDPNSTLKIIDPILNRQQKSDYETSFISLKSQLQSGRNIKIAVLLPLSQQMNAGSSSELISTEMIEGMNYAVKRYRDSKISSRPVMLEIMDTERKISNAIKLVRDAASDDDVVAIIGSLTSDETGLMADEAVRRKIPLIAPTATAVGIAEKGKYIFQANPDFTVRGKLLARYAVGSMKLTTFGIISSNDIVGKNISEYFKKEAERLGGKVIDIQYYTKGSTDLSEQFYNLRKSGLNLSGKKVNEENLDIPVTSIDGLLLAISDPEEIGVLASQINYFNIRTRLLGSNEWYVPGQLEANKRYINGITFLTDSYIDVNDSEYKDFERKFIFEMKKTPLRYSVIGYDLCNILLEQIASGNTTREQIAKSLQILKKYKGMQRLISFGAARVNSEMNILNFENGEIKKVTEISLDD
ncbi:MAG: penicillin-binding protein activator [Ignavibacteriales bacterium]|nr:penicillin-binding protein activator [Ignavibacteriales bacterium]